MDETVATERLNELGFEPRRSAFFALNHYSEPPWESTTQGTWHTEDSQ